MENIVHRTGSGFLNDPSLYFDIIEGLDTTRSPMILVHGGAHTGACYLSTADGRPGWAHHFAARGHKVYVPDWPGSGRSGYIPFDRISGELIVGGLSNLLLSLDEPAILLVHSMAGAFGWKLLERYEERITAIVAVAAAGPGNLLEHAEIVADTPDYVEARLTPLAPPTRVGRNAPSLPPAEWARRKLIGDGARWPEASTSTYLASLQALSPQLVLQRIDYRGSALRVAEDHRFKGVRGLFLVGTNDLDHPVELDRSIAAWLCDRGANFDFVPLGERGVVGNGHMLMLESNSDTIASGISTWLDTGVFPDSLE